MRDEAALSAGVGFLKQIENLGYKAYIVGGAVRNVFIHRDICDLDVTTNCPIQVLKENFDTYNIQTQNGVKRGFGVIIVIFGNYHIDVSRFKDTPTGAENIPTFEEDMKRRDFTVNTLVMDKNGVITDTSTGERDIKIGVIRANGSPDDRFSEDPIRMMRAARFAIDFDFTIEKATRRCIRRKAKTIKTVASERIYAELLKVAFNGPKLAAFIEMLDNLRLLYQILPEISVLKYYKNSLIHHPESITVFGHVMECLKCVDTLVPATYNLALLFHDIGKAITMTETAERAWYKGHAGAGGDMFVHVAKRLKISKLETAVIRFAIDNHIKAKRIGEMRRSKQARIAAHDGFLALTHVITFDEIVRGERSKAEKIITDLVAARDIALRWNESQKRGKNLINGNEIMEVLGIPTGPMVGKVKNLMEEAVLDNNVDIQNSEKRRSLIIKIREDIGRAHE